MRDVKPNSLIELIDSEIKWCQSNKENNGSMYRIGYEDGFEKGLQQAKLLITLATNRGRSNTEGNYPDAI